jgi:tripartite-type tricarboxylate transporter receptor subunit TctC
MHHGLDDIFLLSMCVQQFGVKEIAMKRINLSVSLMAILGMVTPLLTGFVAPVHAATSQNYPVRPVRIVGPETATAGDIFARVIAHAISGPLGQSVIVDSQRSTNMAPVVVAQARPDGYTLLSSSNAFWYMPLLQKMSYDPIKDFLPVAWGTRSPNVIVTHPSLPVKNIQELIALAHSRPGQINFAGGSSGSASHLAGELFKQRANVDMVFVAFKGGGQALNDTIGGHVQVLFANLGAVIPHIKDGKLRALAVTSAQPTALAPELPTAVSAGLPGYVSESINGVFAPAGTPNAIVQRLNQVITLALKQGEIRDRLFSSGMEVVAGSSSDLKTRVEEDMSRMGKLIKDVGIRLE